MGHVSPYPLDALQVLQLRLELVQIGVRIAAQHRAVERVPEHLSARMDLDK